MIMLMPISIAPGQVSYLSKCVAPRINAMTLPTAAEANNVCAMFFMSVLCASELSIVCKPPNDPKLSHGAKTDDSQNAGGVQ